MALDLDHEFGEVAVANDASELLLCLEHSGGCPALAHTVSRSRSPGCPEPRVRSSIVTVEHPHTTDPDGRRVVFDAGSHLHLARRRPWLLDHMDVILGAVARPDHRALDPIAGRERFYRRHVEPGRWLRVVVDFGEEPAWIVTAVVQDNDPGGL